MSRVWRCRNFAWEWERRVLLMGIVNVTPDSFSDGGRFFDTRAAIDHAYRLFEDGADLIDVGGESSRPGAEAVSVEEELRRILPLVEELAGRGNRPVSVDTVKDEVAARALEAGAAVINDISGLQADPRLAARAASAEAGLILMHMRGNPRSMQTLTLYDRLLPDIHDFLHAAVLEAEAAGVRRDHLAVDPGIGFSKTAEQNWTVLNNLDQIRVAGCPLLSGVSRKSFLGKVTGKPVGERLAATAAAVAVSVLRGSNIVRVHDVREMRDVLCVTEAVMSAS